MRVSPLPTPSWGSALPGTLSPSSARSQPQRGHRTIEPPTGDKSGCLEFSSSAPVQFGTQCVPNWKGVVERSYIAKITLIKIETKLGGQPLSHQRQQSCAILGPRPASWLELDQVPSHFPVGACTPSQTPTHWCVSPATHVGVSPLPTPQRSRERRAPARRARLIRPTPFDSW